MNQAVMSFDREDDANRRIVPSVHQEPPKSHQNAMRMPAAGFESAIVKLFSGLTEYAAAHAAAYQSPIMEDGVIGEYWYTMCHATRGLLNGETGRLDCGTLDGQLIDLADGGGTAGSIEAARAVVTPERPVRGRAKQKAEAVGIGLRALSKRQRDLLALVRVENNLAIYTGTERIPDWEQLKGIMTALGGSWKSGGKKAPGGFRFPDELDAAEAVRLAQDTGEIVDPKAAEFFPTPAALADALVQRADIENRVRLLEPSAGTGAIIKAALANSFHLRPIVCVEVLPKNAEACRSLGCEVHERDFLRTHPSDLGELFDAVVMNPPFSKRQDIKHVRHAFNFLSPGGVLVSIMSGGVRYRDDATGREFREWVTANEGDIWDNPDGSFIESGTGVRTCMVRVRRAA